MQTKQEAELIYHWAGESPWTFYTTQPCFTNRLCWRLSQIQEPKVLNAASLVDKGLWVLMCGHICKASTHKEEARFSRELNSPFLALTYRFDFPKHSVPSACWCDASGHAILGARHWVKVRGCKLFCIPEGKTPLTDLNFRKHHAWI